MTDVKECRFYKFVDMNRKNDIGQVRCKRFSTYVNAFEWCDYYSNNSLENLISKLSEAEE